MPKVVPETGTFQWYLILYIETTVKSKTEKSGNLDLFEASKPGFENPLNDAIEIWNFNKDFFERANSWHLSSLYFFELDQK